MSEPSVQQLDLRQLRALRAVVRTGSFGGAGAQLGYTQSAISQQIKALERNVGHQLLDRTGASSPATPTAFGWLVMRHAEAVLNRLDRLEHELAELASGGGGSVRVGFFQSIGATLLPRVVRDVARTLPEVQLVLSEVECDQELQDRVATGELDLCFALAPVPEELFDATSLFFDPTVVVVRDDDPLITGRPLRAADLGDRRLASFGPSPHQRAVDAALRPGDTEAIAIRADDNATLAQLVATGSAIAIMSRLSAWDARTDGLVALDLEGAPAREVVLVAHRARPRAPQVDQVAHVVITACEDGAMLPPPHDERPSSLRPPG